MKKLLVTLLILGIAAGAFAQVKTTITADFNPELMRVTSPSGELAKEENQRSSGTFDALSSTSNSSIGQEDQLRIRFDWSGEGFSARINFNADRFVRWYGFTGSQTPSMVNGNGKSMTAQDLLNSGIEEWYLRGSTGPLSGFVGTSGDRGKTDRFAGGFDDYTKGKIDNYGLITPSNPGTAAGDVLLIIRPGTLANITPILGDGYQMPNGQIPGFGLHDVDNNNFGRAFNTGRNSTYGRGDMAYWSATLDFGQLVGVPLFLAVKGDIGANSGFANLWPPNRATTDNTGLDYSKLNGGVRVSGVKLGNIITFDAVYQFRGGDADTWENDTAGGNIQPDGIGVTAHTFGLYANLFVVNNLGIGIGYSGLFKTYEDLKTTPTSVTQTSTGPFFHGVDLRFQFTGVPNLTITLNNAFTLAFADATSEAIASKRVVGLSGYDLVNGTKEEEAWYALYNGLAINYKLGPALTANFGVSNKMGLFYYDDARPETNNLSVKFMTNQLGATVNAKYQFNSFVMMQGGLQFFYDYASIDVKTTTVAKNFDSGMMYFAIPLRLQVVY